MSKKTVNEALRRINYRMKESPVDRYPMTLWWGCPLARFDHANEERVFAHTNHVPGVICVCEELGSLNEPYIYGIMTHEFGHILAIELHDDHSEEGADQAAWKYLGLPIGYGTALRVQYLKDGGLTELKEALPRPKNPTSLNELPRKMVRLLHNFLFNVVRGCLKAGNNTLVERGFYDLKWMCSNIVDQAVLWILSSYPDVVVVHGGTEGSPDNFLIFSDGEEVVGQVDLSPHAYDLEFPLSYKKGHVRIDPVDEGVFLNYLSTNPKQFVKEQKNG